MSSSSSPTRIPLRVVPYSDTWRELYTREKQALQEALGSLIVKLHHIGSTSVPGLAAKPIIDIMLDVSSLTLLDSAASGMEALDYQVMGEFGIAGRRYYRRGALIRTHHVHAFQSGDANILRHLAFRDYLRAHDQVANQYARLKTMLALKYPWDSDGYCAGKQPFIEHHESKALAWCRSEQFHK